MGRDSWDFSKVLKWYSNADASESACFVLSNYTELILKKKTKHTKPNQNKKTTTTFRHDFCFLSLKSSICLRFSCRM